MHSMEKTVNELHARLKLHEQTLPLKEVAPALHAIRAGRIQKNQKKKSHKAAKGNHKKGKAKMSYAPVQAPPFAPKPKNPPTPKKDNPVKDVICHQCGEVGHWRRNCPVYLAELIKKKKLSQGASTSSIFTIELYSFPSTSWVYDTSYGTHICINTQDLRGSRKLDPGALNLYVADGHHAGVEAIGEFHLCLPSGLVLILHNCHYTLSITRGIVSVSRLYKDAFVNRFENDNSSSISKNNLIYFNAIPRDDIYEIVLSNTNDSSMYVVSNKRAKLNLDSALLWHCRLGHINKKRIEKLQHDGLLDSTNIKYFLKCVACISGKMERKSYSHQVERAKDLLALIHTDVCGPFKIMSRQGAYYFVTFSDEFSRYSFYYPPENKVFVARNVEFFDNDVIDHEASRSLEDLKIIQEEDMHPSIDTSLNHEEDDQEIDAPQSDINPIRRSTKTRRSPDRMCLYIDAEEYESGDLDEPANYKAALLDHKSDKWLNAMNVEMQSMKYNEVWELVDLPPNEKTVGHKWLFKKKKHTYKDRLASRQWNKRFDDEIKKFGFSQNRDKPYVYIKASRSYVTFLILYVDDILIMGNNIPMLQDVKSYLGRYFAMKDLREAAYILGIKIYLDRGDTKRELRVSCYTNAGYLTDADDMKSQTRYLFILNRGDVDWKSTKQSIFATSSTDAEYIVIFDASKEAVWIPSTTLVVNKEFVSPLDMCSKIPWALSGINQIIACPCPKDVANYQYICKPATPTLKWELLEYGSRFRSRSPLNPRKVNHHLRNSKH
uniref:Retrotransposon protein, putative, Ty1-copia subclass n=1 Tax=Tanacetum cinerariifolium TaxID=118510 RepID=A0A6L2J8P0_TANCI|nr:retrotransposon protein, putative, Ty1-copia subclass [Tanacetum cinerariifolium]